MIELGTKKSEIENKISDIKSRLMSADQKNIELKNINNKVGIFLSRFNIASISVSYDFYTYKNILILPFSKKGDIEVILNDGKEIKNIKCNEIEILLVDKPQYIKHIKKTE